MHHRIVALVKLHDYLIADTEDWRGAKRKALNENAWFTEEYINLAVKQICKNFLDDQKLTDWVAQYPEIRDQKTVGIVAAGNIPLVVFHDFLCAYMSGHKAQIKLSSKDQALFSHIHHQMQLWDSAFQEQIQIVNQLKDCEAFIATGSNNSSRYFEAYFGKKPHIIRRNRTSVAILNGTETESQLEALSEDVFQYFGLGCRNVTQLWVPEDYDFSPLMKVFSRYEHMIHHHKYKNNYDYHLAIYLLNKVPFLTNETIMLVQNDIPFSPVSVLHYQYYTEPGALRSKLQSDDNIQVIVGEGEVPFGTAQQPTLNDYADGIDTMAFLSAL